MQAFLRTKIPTESVDKVEILVNKFCFKGQVAIGSLCVFAQEAGKLEEALGILDKQYEKHHVYQHPEVCGDPDFGNNQYHLISAYEELGIDPRAPRR
jgi:hypothetical protein